MRRRFQPHHVSIHAPAWGTTLRQTSGQRLDSCFNPRTRVGCDCGCWCGPTASSRFNPRTRVGCDSRLHAYCFRCGLFQSTHPRGVRLTFMAKQLPPDRFQSTHPRGVRPLPAGALLVATLVSIHAPAWGATSIELAFVSPFYLFQSTHPRGVRRHGLQALLLKILFQSTHPRGVRLALAWPWELYSVCFNPRTRVGCDQVCSIIGDAKTLFQSTHPRGVRPHTGSAPPRPWRRFNPRTRVGCDGMSLVKSLGSMGFNPRTRVGCDNSKTWITSHAS